MIVIIAFIDLQLVELYSVQTTSKTGIRAVWNAKRGGAVATLPHAPPLRAV